MQRQEFIINKLKIEVELAEKGENATEELKNETLNGDIINVTNLKVTAEVA